MAAAKFSRARMFFELGIGDGLSGRRGARKGGKRERMRVEM